MSVSDSTRLISPVVRKHKSVIRDSNWKNGKITPTQHGKLWPRTLLLSDRWLWRSIMLDCGDAAGELVCLFQINPGSAKHKAFLIEVGDRPGEGRLLLRCEHHPGRNAGLHVHTYCPHIPEARGPQTISARYRLPGHDAHHRRGEAIQRDGFFILVCAMFRIDSPEAKQPSLKLDTPEGQR